jgi:hypothetical protein
MKQFRRFPSFSWPSIDCQIYLPVQRTVYIKSTMETARISTAFGPILLTFCRIKSRWTVCLGRCKKITQPWAICIPVRPWLRDPCESVFQRLWSITSRLRLRVQALQYVHNSIADESSDGLRHWTDTAKHRVWNHLCCLQFQHGSFGGIQAVRVPIAQMIALCVACMACIPLIVLRRPRSDSGLSRRSGRASSTS